MAPKSGDTSVIDGLKKMVSDVAQLQAAPDAQQLMGPLQQLQQMLIGLIRQGAAADAASQAAMRQPGGPLGRPGPGAGGPPPGAGPAQPMQGMSPGPTDADELRRMLSSARPGA